MEIVKYQEEPELNNKGFTKKKKKKKIKNEVKEQNKKKYDKILLLAKTKLSSIELLISKDLVDWFGSRD